MDPTQPLRILMSLSRFVDTVTIVSIAGPGGQQTDTSQTLAPHSEVYLWTAFFKIDGDTTLMNNSLSLQGTATVIGTPGNQGDLGATNLMTGSDVAINIPIPPQLGEFRTTLKPIPLQTPIGSIKNIPGAVGCVALLIKQGDLPDEAVAKGHDAFNSTLQTQLDQLIVTLGVRKRAPTPDDISSMTQAISDAVNSAITQNLSFWQKVAAFFFGPDQPVGHTLFQFSGNDLANAPATGLLLQDATILRLGGTGPAAGGNGSTSISETYLLQGVIFCDPLDLSLRRFLQSQSLNPTAGIRSFMQPQFSSVRNWMASALW